jgi:hypothetical protein
MNFGGTFATRFTRQQVNAGHFAQTNTMNKLRLTVGFCLLLSLLCSPIINAQTKDAKHAHSAPVLLPVKVSGKWGYVNSTGQLVINPQFDNAKDFYEGRAAVCIGKPCDWLESPGDSRWGYIDTSGKLIIAPQYASVSSFSEGLASVCTKDCSGPDTRGYIDREGKLVIPMQFGTAHDFEEGFALVCIGKCDWAIDGGYNGKFGFIDHSGHFVINPQYYSGPRNSDHPIS